MISIIGWVAIAGILVRLTSGGGTLRGVGYVLGTEQLGVVVLIVTSLTVAIGAIVGLVGDVRWAWRFSSAGASIALITSLILVLDGHASAWVAGLASSLVLAGRDHPRAGSFEVLSRCGAAPPVLCARRRL